MRNKAIRRRWGLWGLAVTLAVALLMGACGPTEPSTSGSGNTVVEIGNLTPLTGAAGTAEQPCFQGIFDYCQWFNEKNGIPEVTIDALWYDHGRETPKFISGYQRFRQRNVPLYFSNDTPSLEALKAQFDKNQTPFLTGTAMGNMVYPPGWIYTPWVTFDEAAVAVMDYFMQNWKEDRPPKMVFMALDSTFGREPAERGAKYAESVGYEVLPLEVVPYIVLDATTQLIRINEEGADLAYIQAIVSAAGPIMKDVERLDLLDEIQFSGTEYATGGAMIEQVGAAGMEGFLFPKLTPWFNDTEVPGIRDVIDMSEKYHGKLIERQEYLAGYVYGVVMCEVIKRAGEEVGFENIDGAACGRAYQSLKDFDVDGLVTITYGPDRRRGSRNAACYEYQNGEIVRLTDWEEMPILIP